MLDKLGLTQKDGDGFRQRTDGKGRLTFEVLVFAASGMPYTQICELARTHAQAVGVDLQVNEIERSLGEARIAANEHQMIGVGGRWHRPPVQLPRHRVADGAGRHFGHAMGPVERHQRRARHQAGSVDDPGDGEFPQGVRPEVRGPRAAGEGDLGPALVDNVHAIGTVGLSPAFMGVRVVKNTMGNVPSRQYNSPDVRTPSVSRMMSVYFKA